MKLIPLSKQGRHKGKYFAQVDDVDFEEINKYRDDNLRTGVVTVNSEPADLYGWNIINPVIIYKFAQDPCSI